VQITALMWLAYRLTGTSFWPSLMAAAQMMPACLLGAWGGALADRGSRLRLITRTQTALMVLAFVLFGLMFTGQMNVWLLLGLALSIGFVNAIDLPARLAILIELSGKDDLPNAVALNSMMFNLARAAGPELGKWFLRLGGASLCFFLNGLSYLAVLASLLSMRLRSQAPAASPRANSWSALSAGFAYVVRHPVLVLLAPLTIAVAMFGWPLLALLPAISDHQFHAGDEGYSSLLSALGAGALVAAFLVAAFGSVARRWLFLCGGGVLAASALLGLSFARTLPFGMLCTSLAGLGLILFFATAQSVFQLCAGDDNRGRVMGIYSIILAGANPVGTLVMGSVADWWTEPPVLRLQGTGILLASLLVILLRLTRARGTIRSRQVSECEIPPETETIAPHLLDGVRSFRRTA
jgi:predicted MFS family arabinose efflux permease